MASKKTYTKEFKEEAVRLARQNGNVTETARNLGLQLSVLRRWKKELADHGEKPFRVIFHGHTADEEMRQLQRENQRLKETVEILKKAVGIFTSLLLERYPFIEEHRKTHIRWSGINRCAGQLLW